MSLTLENSPTVAAVSKRERVRELMRTIGMLLDGRGLLHRGAHNEPVTDSSYLLVLHAGDDEIDINPRAKPVRLRAAERIRRTA